MKQNSIWNREPVMLLSVVQAGIILAVSFGVNLTEQQTGAILTLSSVLLGLVTRSQVTPTGGK